MNPNDKLGTPANLEEVVIRILCFRPPHNLTPQSWVHGIIKDYLAQKFGVAILKAHTPEQQAIVEELWHSITGEKIGGKK